VENIDLLNALYNTYKIHNIIHIHAELFYHLSFTISFPDLQLPCH